MKFTGADNQKILLTFPKPCDLEGRYFSNWADAVEFLLAYEPAVVEVYYGGCRAHMHHYKTLRRLTAEDLEPPTGYKWSRF